MKVLLIQDVYKLGRAGDVKRVANGYGRNYLIPQGLAILATPGAMKQAERIRVEADKKRIVLNQEMSGIAELLDGVTLTFPARASETGRLYGSINTRMIAEAVSEKAGTEITHRQIDSQPLRMIGEHTVSIRLTVDLFPEIKVIVHREGESVAAALEEAEMLAEAEAAGEPVQLEYLEALDAEEAEAEVAEEAEASEPEGENEDQVEVESEAEGEEQAEADSEAEETEAEETETEESEE
jgi:large subunit ribosomal protein L9